jgi:twitching motility two-component system response regulator PilG
MTKSLTYNYKTYILDLLENLSSRRETADLRVFNSSVQWSVHFRQGKIAFATHSVYPIERLERHLRKLGVQVPGFVTDASAQLRVGVRGCFKSRSQLKIMQGVEP